jgi:hypothetical protein
MLAGQPITVTPTTAVVRRNTHRSLTGASKPESYASGAGTPSSCRFYDGIPTELVARRTIEGLR